MNACFCNGIQNPPTWRVFLLEWVAVLRVEWVAGLVSLQVEGFDRYVWLSWGGIRSQHSPAYLHRQEYRPWSRQDRSTGDGGQDAFHLGRRMSTRSNSQACQPGYWTSDPCTRDRCAALHVLGAGAALVLSPWLPGDRAADDPGTWPLSAPMQHFVLRETTQICCARICVCSTM